MSQDAHQYNSPGLEAPASNAREITKSDTVELPFVSRAIYIGGDGNLAVTMKSGQVVTFVGLVAGTVLPIRVTKVMSTNTTATSIVALY